jgi:hypothetical protein
MMSRRGRKKVSPKKEAAEAKKSESFGTWFGRKHKELGEGKTARWTDPKTGKSKNILLTHEKPNTPTASKKTPTKKTPTRGVPAEGKSITRNLANRGARKMRSPGSAEATEKPSILRGIGDVLGGLRAPSRSELMERNKKKVSGHKKGGSVRGVGAAKRGFGRGKTV